MKTILDKFSVIGLDMDGTLVDGAEKSVMLRRWVCDNWQHKTFYVVTFRTGAWADDVIPELESYGVSRFAIKAVLSVPFVYWQGYNTLKVLASLPPDERDDAIATGRVDVDRCKQLLAAYKSWKGEVCAQHGIQVLVDDKPEFCTDGCRQHGVKFVDVADFTYEFVAEQRRLPRMGFLKNLRS